MGADVIESAGLPRAKARLDELLAGLADKLLLGPIQNVTEFAKIHADHIISTGGDDALSIGRERCFVDLVAMPS